MLLVTYVMYKLAIKKLKIEDSFKKKTFRDQNAK